MDGSGTRASGPVRKRNDFPLIMRESYKNKRVSFISLSLFSEYLYLHQQTVAGIRLKYLRNIKLHPFHSLFVTAVLYVGI